MNSYNSKIQAVEIAMLFDLVAVQQGLVNPKDRDARAALRLGAYDLLVKADRAQAVDFLCTDLDTDLAQRQPAAEKFRDADPTGFFGSSTTGRRH